MDDALSIAFAHSLVTFRASFDAAATNTVTPKAQAGPEPTPLSKFLVAGPVVAYRFWAVHGDGEDVWLQSLVIKSERWIAGAPAKAKCVADVPSHAAPLQLCRCGLYGLKNPTTLTAPYMPLLESEAGTFRAIAAGHVAFWGKVIEHEAGYRAEYAYPVAIWPWYPEYPLPWFVKAPALTRLPWFFKCPTITRLFHRLGDNYGCRVLERAPRRCASAETGTR